MRPNCMSAAAAEPPRGHMLAASTIAPPANAVSRTVSVQKSRSCSVLGQVGQVDRGDDDQEQQREQRC